MGLFLETTAAGGGMGSMIVMMLAVLAIMYFLMIRPENKKKKEAEQMRSAVKVGDKITTIGGVVGVVCAVKDDKIVVETSADRVRVEFAKWAISSNDTANEAAKAAAEKAAAARKKRRPPRAKSNPEMAVAGVSRGGNTGCCFHRMFAYI